VGSLERLALDPRVASIERDAEFIAVVLRPGWAWDAGQHVILEFTVKATLRAVRQIFACRCPVCITGLEEQQRKGTK